MRTADTSPVNTVFGSILCGGTSLGDEGNTFSEVEVGFVFGVNSLDFDQTDGVVLGAQSTFVAQDGTVDVKADRLTVIGRHFVLF